MKYVFIGLLLATCSPSVAQVKSRIIWPGRSIVFKTDSTEGMIFRKAFKPREGGGRVNLVRIFSKDENAKLYVPSIAVVVNVEEILKNYLAREHRDLKEDLSHYVKQYFGYITSKGDTILCINCFWNDEIKKEKYWQKEPVNVFDGGSNYFRVRYNVTKKEFFAFRENGLG
ncbi:hypothetical protein ACFQ48_16610 [Hymenobacter caeli]|uniref:DUF4294 domain-containing protein n=1 Tax=Hymenobacter caeli TaxID=2735894 RepID=A0ABX2FUD7_9BACT|nr:hypothetical protein [Hymenobacter caeli]NRT20636.1 hypothetical protein [Hymenobacter caeli]